MEGQMTYSARQEDAKQFLINKITYEAELKGVSLSYVEQKMLQVNLADPESAAGIPVSLLRDKEQQFEAKIAGLLRSAYARADDNPGEQELIRDATESLTGSTHYIIVPASTALAPQPGGWSFVILIVISLALGGAAVWYALHKG